MREEATLFHGCIEVEETPYGLVPRRFTQAQLAHWDQIGMVRAARAHGIAGTTMSFVTDQAQISFSYHVLSICGEKMTFDLYEGERLTDSITRPTQDLEGRVVFSLLDGGTEQEVTIYLPFTAELAFSAFSEGLKPIEKTAYSGRILWLGDSISQGMHALHPSQTLVGILGRTWKYEIINQGVGGCGYKDICRDFTYGDWHPDLLVLLLGTNDTGPADVSWDAYQAQVRECLDCAQERFLADQIRLISPFWRGDQQKEEIGRPFRRIVSLLKEEAKRRGVAYIDGEKVSPHCNDLYWDERLHPNDTGFAVICEALRGRIL